MADDEQARRLAIDELWDDYVYEVINEMIYVLASNFYQIYPSNEGYIYVLISLLMETPEVSSVCYNVDYLKLLIEEAGEHTIMPGGQLIRVLADDVGYYVESYTPYKSRQG